MKRSAFKRRELPPRREREAGEFASFKPTPRRAVMASSLGELAPVAIAPKVPGRKSQAIRDHLPAGSTQEFRDALELRQRRVAVVVD